MTPDTLLTVVNLTVPRKPDRGPTISPDPLAAPATAAQALGLPRLAASELDALRELHKTIVLLVEGLLSGGSLANSAARLTRLAQPSVATVVLELSNNQILGRAAEVERTHAGGNTGSPGCLRACRGRPGAPEALRASRL